MDKLKEQSDVESVKTVYVSKNDSFFDIDDLRWNTIEIVITSKKNETTWKDKKFRKSLFSKCYLWETVETNLGEHTRAYFFKQKEDQRNSELRARGYIL